MKLFRTFKSHLAEELKDPEFKKMYEEQKELLKIALQIVDMRNELNYSQKQLAEKAQITQQQLSRIENAQNCNVLTLLKVFSALGIKFELHRCA